MATFLNPRWPKNDLGTDLNGLDRSATVPSVLSAVVDLTDAAYSGLAASDIIKALAIPAGYVALSTGLQVVTPTGAATTCTMSEGAGGAGNIHIAAGHSLNSAAIKVSDGDAWETTGNVQATARAYAADTNLFLTIAGTLPGTLVGKFVVWAVVARIDGN